MISNKWSGVLVAILLGSMFIPVILRETGDGERLGVVIYTRKTSFPCKLTLVEMRAVYTEGIMNQDSFSRFYYGWHDFELGKLYRISYHKEWNQIYKRITAMEIVEID